MTDYLRRHTAPLSERVWTALDEAVAQAARHILAARRVATFDGPHGWDHVAARTGSMTPCGAPDGRAVVCVPEVVLLCEIRVDFSLPWSSIEVFERGAPVLDTGPAEAAAREAALAEDRLAFYGDPVGGGFLTAKDSPRVQADPFQRFSQTGHCDLQAPGAGRQAGRRPQFVDQPVSRHRLPTTDEQQCEQQPHTGTADIEAPRLPDHFQWSEEAELHAASCV